MAITDASIKDYDQALLEIVSITLIGDGGQQTEVLDAPQTIDLLKLRNVSELLLRETLTVRSISKIRLGVERITLNKVDLQTGMITESVSPPVPTRKIDLNPQGPLQIRAGQDLLVMLDVDLEKSIRITQTGGAQQLRFRPLVFVTAGVTGLVRLYGTYTVEDAGTRICDLQRVSDADGIFEVLDICISLDETNATYFGTDGLPLSAGDPGDPGDLAHGQKVSVYGFYQATASGEALAAEIIARGTAARGEAFTTVNGIITDAWDEPSRRFILGLAGDTTIPVELSNGAKVFDLTVTPETTIEPSGLTVDVLSEARGAFTDSGDTSPDWIQAFIAFTTGATETDSLVGTVNGVATDTQVITLQEANPVNDAVANACIVATADTDFYRIETSGDITAASTITIADLLPLDTIYASGQYIGDCLQATTVIQETVP
jgi:hypothetical protein